MVHIQVNLPGMSCVWWFFCCSLHFTNFWAYSFFASSAIFLFCSLFCRAFSTSAFVTWSSWSALKWFLRWNIRFSSCWKKSLWIYNRKLFFNLEINYLECYKIWLEWIPTTHHPTECTLSMMITSLTWLLKILLNLEPSENRRFNEGLIRRLPR